MTTRSLIGSRRQCTWTRQRVYTQSAGVSKEELDKAYDETLNKVADHQVVEGTVISVDKKEVVVNIGYKSDGIIPASEFRYNPDLKIGDKVEVYVESLQRRHHRHDLHAFHRPRLRLFLA